MYLFGTHQDMYAALASQTTKQMLQPKIRKFKRLFLDVLLK